MFTHLMTTNLTGSERWLVRLTLAVLDLALRWGTEASRRATWAVLTALRGPDNEDLTLKYVSTAIVRTVALPRTARLSRLPAMFCCDPSPHVVPTPDQLRVGGYHFESHVTRALAVLRQLHPQQLTVADDDT